MRDAHKRYVAMVEKIEGSLAAGSRKQALCCTLLYLKDTAKGPVTGNCEAKTVDYLKGLLSMVVSVLLGEVDPFCFVCLLLKESSLIFLICLPFFSSRLPSRMSAAA